MAMEQYGGMLDCQRFRDVMLYSLSVFSNSVPEAVGVLADCMLRPGLKEQEVRKHRPPLLQSATHVNHLLSNVDRTDTSQLL